MPNFPKSDWPLSFYQGVSYHYLKYTWNYGPELRQTKIIKILAIVYQNFWDNVLVVGGFVPFVLLIIPLNINTHMLRLLENTSNNLWRFEKWMID